MKWPSGRPGIRSASQPPFFQEAPILIYLVRKMQELGVTDISFFRIAYVWRFTRDIDVSKYVTRFRPLRVTHRMWTWSANTFNRRKAIRTEIHTDLNAALLIFDLTEELDRRLYVAYLNQIRTRVHPADQSQVDMCLATVEKCAPEFPGYTAFTE